ncbi:MAG: DUF5667 domain-containing protein, partial [Anaerolineae bacterium]
MTEKSLDHILAQCLEEAERTGDIGAALRGHPEHADELQPLLELAFVARRLYAEVPPPPGGLAWGRARLLSQARRAHSVARADDRVVARRERGSPVLSRLAAAFMAAGAAVAILAFGLVAVTRAADGAVPGHPLYGLDRALEQVEARLTRDPSSLAQLRLRLAEERLGEVAQLVQAEDQSHLEEALGAYSDAVVALARVAGAGQGTGDLAAALALDRVLASHEKQLRSALQGAGGGEDDPWCTGQGTHPVAAALARRYAVEADTVMSWFCEDNFGLGEIMHALQTSELLSGTGVPSDTTPAALLALKADLGGWGQVWQELGLIGRPSEPSPPGQEDKPEPPGQENKPEPPGQEDKPEPPGQDDKSVPPGEDDKSVPP